MGDDLYALETLLERFGVKFQTTESVVSNSKFVTVNTGTPKVAGKDKHCIEYHFDDKGSFIGMGVYKDD